MKTTNKFAFFLILLAIIIVGIKFKLNIKKLSDVAEDNSETPVLPASARSTLAQQKERVITTPVGTVPYNELYSKFDMVSQLNQENWLDEMRFQYLKKLKPYPWQIYQNEDSYVVKMQAGEVGQSLVNYDDIALNYFEKQQGYTVEGIDDGLINFNNKSIMKQLVSCFKRRNILDNATEEMSSSVDSKEVEIYPVAVRYVTPMGSLDTRNQDYFGDRTLSMLLIKANNGNVRKEERQGEEWDHIFNTYGPAECRMVVWQLILLPRDEKEAEWFSKAPVPYAIGCGFQHPAPYVARWEKVHGKKYVEK